MEQTTQTSNRPSRRRTFSGAGDEPRFDHEVLEIARVVRVVKGGRRFRFRATVVVGDRNGTVGIGVGKSRDIQQAIQKAQDRAEKNAIKISLTDGTIAQQAIVKHKGAIVMVKPARSGTGVIAGGTIRTVADLAGIKDMVSKRFGSNTKINNAAATLKALAQASQ